MRKVKQKGQKVNVGKVLSHITTKDITETNNLIRAGAFVVGRSLGIKKGRTNEPPWKNHRGNKGKRNRLMNAEETLAG